MGVGLAAGILMLSMPPALCDAWEDIDAAMTRGDSETAFRLVLELAQQGDLRAQSYLGFLYDHGKGVEEDDKQAFYWYKTAAERGHPGAQGNLCSKYIDRGTAADLEQAVLWCRRSAEQDHEFGQFLLGTLYLYGDGVKQDVVEAYKWFLLSQARAKTDSTRGLISDSLQEAGEQLTQEQIEDAKRRAASWKPATP
jgi:TPR repeat protein